MCIFTLDNLCNQLIINVLCCIIIVTVGYIQCNVLIANALMHVHVVMHGYVLVCYPCLLRASIRA